MEGAHGVSQQVRVEDLLVLPKYWVKMGTESRGEERGDSSLVLRIYQNTVHRCDPTVAAAA